MGIQEGLYRDEFIQKLLQAFFLNFENLFVQKLRH